MTLKSVLRRFGVALLVTALGVGTQAKQVVTGQLGVVATAHPLATNAATRVLDEGGNAADAAIAAAFMLAVVEPTMSSIGGRNQILVRRSNGEFLGYDGMTEVPAGYVAPAEAPAQGYATIAIPGVVAALARLHEEQGLLPLADLLAPAITTAEQGFGILPAEAARHARALKLIKDNPGFQRTFLRDGRVHAPGERLRQPILGQTLRQLSVAGLGDFYKGETARAIAADMRGNGGFVTQADLASYKARDARVVSFSYRGHEIHSIAAPAGGGLVIKALNILANFDLGNMSEAAWATRVSRALALSFRSMGDDPGELDVAAFLQPAWGRARAQTILDADSQNSAPDRDDGSHPPEHHTTHFSIVDCAGMVVTSTQTLGPAFGSKVVTPGLGFVYASTMGSYLSSADQHPGSRPRTAIAPTVVTRDGKVEMVLGAAGGRRIVASIVQAISRFLDRGAPPVDAVAAPRIYPGHVRNPATGAFDPQLHALEAETTPGSGWSDTAIAQMLSLGFTVDPVPRIGAFGRIHAIAAVREGWVGIADPDWEGSANAQNKTCQLQGQ